MFSWFRNWLRERAWPVDPNFIQRPKSKNKFGRWLLVEIGANDYSILVDLLSQIQLSNESVETKGHQIIGLRYMAIAMSVRTKSGRYPLNWQEESDLMWLGQLPYSEITPALEEISLLSDLPWISPNFVASKSDEGKDVEVLPPSEEELEQNPS